MRIAKTSNYIPYVPLRKDVSKAMIAGGVFDNGPSEVIWALPVTPQPTVAKPTPVDAAGSETRKMPVIGVVKMIRVKKMVSADDHFRRNSLQSHDVPQLCNLGRMVCHL
jgi:hypothetical protein